MTFDAWELSIRPSNDYLAHHGIRGMKHGRNRYQNEDGTWTEEGLRRRRQREGFGDGKDERRAAKAAARTEKKDARKAARAEATAARKEERRKRNVKKLTDEELRNRIERLKMENEYRELKRSPYVKSGEKLISDYLKNRAEKEQRAYNEKQTKLAREHEMARLKEQTRQTELRANADTARANADRTRAETDRIDIEKGTRLVKLKNEGKNLKLQNKRYVSDNTVRGGVKKMINRMLVGKATNNNNDESKPEEGKKKKKKSKDNPTKG